MMEMELNDTDQERIFIIKEDLIPLNISQLEEILNRFIKEDDRDVIIDLDSINKIDSLAMALFIRLKKKLEENGRTLFVTNPNDTVVRVLKLSGLDEFLLE